MFYRPFVVATIDRNGVYCHLLLAASNSGP
jgi:hypothetical protein